MRLRESAVANAEWVDAQRDGASTVTGRINVDLLLAGAQLSGDED
jgi:hypothetical protein